MHLSRSAAVAALVAALAVAQPAVAGPREGLRLVDGPRGRPVLAGRSIERAPGAIHVERGLRGARGRGVTTTRDTIYGDGRVENQVRRSWANGAEATRTGSVVRNADGSVSASRTRTGARGATQSGWSTIYKTDDGYARDRGVTTSGGRSAQVHGDVSIGEDSVTVTRRTTTGSGATVSRSATYPRR